MERTGLLPFKIGALNRINYLQIISSATNAKTVSVADGSLSYLTVTGYQSSVHSRIEFAKLLNISDFQLSYITNVRAGQGGLKVSSSLVPFVNKFPRNTELYNLMTSNVKC